MSTLLHGLLVLGAIWFWTLRPPELRPMFQDGDVSLAVTFVAAEAEARGAWSVERGATADPPTPRRYGGQATEDSGRRKSETTDILTDPETEMPDDGLPTDVSGEALAKTEALAKAGRQTADPPTPRRYGGQVTDSAVEPPSDALRQGVRGAVRRKSEIRPYYPLGARLRGEEGVVTVRVWVKPSGRVSRSEVIRSSGFPALDEAAVDAARRARYVSTRPGAWRAEVETTLTFRFRLTE